MNRKYLHIAAASAAMLIMAAGIGLFASDSHGMLTGSANPKTATAAVKATDELNLTEGTVVSNVFFEGESLSGLTPEKAAEICRKPIQNLKKKEFIIQSKTVEDHRYSGTAKDVGITWDDSSVDSELAALVVEGTLIERYKFAKDVQYTPVEIEVEIKIDEKKATSYFEFLQDEWKTEAVSANVSGMTGTVVVTPGQNGLEYNFTDGIAELVVDVLSGDIDTSDEYYIDPGEEVIEPLISTERAASFSIIGSFTTNYSAPTSTVLANREQNLVQSTSNMNGHMFAPGEEISALSMYGSVSEAGGYRPAGTIAGGVHVDEVGGGICQTTTTLYNAGLYAELEIVYRHNHSLLVNYVDPSRDAMVYAAGGSDFKMRNNTSDYIIIESWVDKSTLSIHVIIIGHEDHAADHTVEYESEIIDMTLAPITIVDDPSLPIGFTEEPKFKLVTSDASSPATKSRLWKITTDGGVQNRTLVNAQDTYGAQPCTYAVAPDTHLEFHLTSERATMYLSISPSYLDGTPVSWNIPAAKDEEIIAFNSEMTTLMAAKGLTWPYSYTGYTADSPSVRPGGVPQSEPESEPSESSEESSERPGPRDDSRGED